MTAVLAEPVPAAQVTVRGRAAAGFPRRAEHDRVERGARRAVARAGREWLVLGGREEDYPGAAAVVDVSAKPGRAREAPLGPEAAGVLASGCSVELAPGGCAQTLLARAQVILFRPGLERWWILVRPSFAPYLRAWLEDAVTSEAVRFALIRIASDVEQ